MSDDPPKSQFSAEMLDSLDVRNSKSSARTTDIPTFATPFAATTAPPPKFDSFPDFALPKPTVSTAPPSFSSFPADTLFQIPAPQLEKQREKSSGKEKSAKSSSRDESWKSKPSEIEDSSDKRLRSESGDKSRHDDSDRKAKDKNKDRRPEDDRRDSLHVRDRYNERRYGGDRSDRLRDRDRHRERRHDDSRRDSPRDSDRSRDKQRDTERGDRPAGRTREGYRAREHEEKRSSSSYSSSKHGQSGGSTERSPRERDRGYSPDRKRSRYSNDNDEARLSARRNRDQERNRITNVNEASHETQQRKTAPPQKPAQKTGWGERNIQKVQKPGEWVMDVKGDQNNIRFGGANLLEVPKYTRAGNGRVLGLPDSVKIDFEKSREIGFKQIVMRTGGRSSKSMRYSDNHATWRDQSHEYKRISRAKAEELARKLNLHLENSSYISLNVRPESSGKSDKKGDSDSDGESLEESQKKVDYRDIHGKSVYKEEDEDLLQTTSDQEEECAESAMDVLIRRRMMLDAELRKDPKHPAKWLEFIAVGDEIDLITSRRSTAAASGHSTGHTEIKLSIFERALESNPTDPDLLLHYMNTCRLCWEPAKVLTKWDELLQSTLVQKSWPGLWIEYLDFRQRHFLSFSVKSFIEVLQDALEKLGLLVRSTRMDAERTGTALSSDARTLLVKLECVMVHVMARAWSFLKQAGYVERSQAILQAQVEFLFNMPAGLESEPWFIQIGSLEEYWDSELPRFGEKDAKGWSHYVTEEDEVNMENLLEKAKLPEKDAPSDELVRALAEDDMDRYQYGRWAKLEKGLNASCWFPIRTTEDLPDELEDDPYGIIIFDDIRPFIVPLHSIEARHQFLDCMYSFLGLPLNSLGSSNNPQKSALRDSAYQPYFHDGLLLNLGMDIQSNYGMNPGLKNFFPAVITKEQSVQRVLREIENLNMDVEMEERDWSCVWKTPVKLYPQGTGNLFGELGNIGSGSRQVTYPWSTVTSDEEVQWTNKIFVRNTFQQLVDIVPLPKAKRESLLHYYLMYENLEAPTGSKGQKLAKKYLKIDRMDLELWNAYAQAEKMLGRINEARKVYSTVISMYRSFPQEHQVRSPLIYRYFAELEWEQGRPAVALEILLSFAEGSEVDLSVSEKAPKPSPTRLIKARQFYSQKVARLDLGKSSSVSDGNTIGGKWFEPQLDVVVCHAWFEYLSVYVPVTASAPGSGSAIDGGIKVFEGVIQGLDFRNPEAEISSTDPFLSSSSGSFLSRVASVTSAGIATATASPVKRKVCVGVEAEMVWIQMAKMVYFHSLQATSSKSSTGTGGYQPRDLRRIVHSGLERFPNCAILQSLFFWTEAKQRIHGRVRTWVLDQVSDRSHNQISASTTAAPGTSGQKLLPSSTIRSSKASLWIFGLFYELWQQEPYNPHMVRSLLESALDSSKSTSFNSSPNLWMIYIELELRESARQRELVVSSKKDKGKKDQKKSKIGPGLLEPSTKPKQLLMRALNDCPWCKDLYLLAFEPRMRHLFSIDELDQLYQTMLEKEIRIRHEIPERAPRPEPTKDSLVVREDSDMSDSD
ncbi:hypothetical protein EMPS_05836 [Entomortierella parvispora]|uniref:Uncharacterized protein n=1 Tax=Entomortierella parvispora TaxID=205924 RepID=A0A9P3LWW4_9FUNG|nr:hypothetical protein EMPS_05836 [Entomortierella parvispora]